MMRISTTPFDRYKMDEILQDLSTRFIINVPSDELESIQRVCFQIEQAHWYYEDFIKEVNSTISSLSLKQFSLLLFTSCPLLQHWVQDHEKVFHTFLQYKVRVPVCGAILLNQDLTRVLLVRGYKSQSTWSFPKGKINQNESETSCAIREVFEETGFDCSMYIRDEYIERVINNQRMRLYIVTGVDERIKFTTLTRKEIGDIKWHDLASLPGYTNTEKQKNGKNEKTKFAIHTSNKKYKLYVVTPFMTPLKKWINKFKKAKQQGKARKNAALKVVMDQVTGDEEEVDEVEEKADHLQEYDGIVPVHQQVHLEDSLKKLLGLTGDEWEMANRLSHSLPDPNRGQPIPFGTMPGMELPNNFSQEQYSPAHAPLVQPIPPEYTSESESSEAEEPKNELLDILVGRPSQAEQVKKNELLDILVGRPSQTDQVKGNSSHAPQTQINPLLDILVGRPSQTEQVKGNSSHAPQAQSNPLMDILVGKPRDTVKSHPHGDEMISQTEQVKSNTLVDILVGKGKGSTQGDKMISKPREGEKGNSLAGILVEKPPATETKKKRKNKLGYGQVTLLTREQVSDTHVRTASPPPKKEVVDLLLKESPQPATPALNTEGLLKLLVQSQSPRHSDPGLEQVLSGRKIESPLNHEKQTLEDILRGAPPLPSQSMSESTNRPNSSPRAALLQDIFINPPKPEPPRFEKPLFSQAVSEQVLGARPVEFERSKSATNPFAGSLLDILTKSPTTIPSNPKTEEEKKTDLLKILLNK